MLGSWGDNELSPECLDGAQKYLKGIRCRTTLSNMLKRMVLVFPLITLLMLPQYLHRAFGMVCAGVFTFLLSNSIDFYSFGTLKDFETPYVVKIHNAHELSAIQECFYFQHPNNSVPIDNQRYRMLSFPISINSMVHGFAGYFHATLYKHVNISKELALTNNCDTCRYSSRYLLGRNVFLVSFVYSVKGQCMSAFFHLF